jgi:hypothetical protein
MYFVPQCGIVCGVMSKPHGRNHVSKSIVEDVIVVGIARTIFTVDAEGWGGSDSEIVEGVVVYAVVLAFYLQSRTSELVME